MLKVKYRIIDFDHEALDADEVEFLNAAVDSFPEVTNDCPECVEVGAYQWDIAALKARCITAIAMKNSRDESS